MRAARILPAVDPELFSRGEDADGGRRHSWRLRLAPFVAAPTRAVSDLRTALANAASALASAAPAREDGPEPHDPPVEPDKVPDDLLVTASVIGAVTSAPFLDILDGSGFVAAPCLCCYAARSVAAARDAASALRLLERYYDAESYLRSRSFARAVANLSRDLTAAEVTEIADSVASMDGTPEAVREINRGRAGRLCVVVPPCRPGSLWVYSTPEGRRLLRFLSRKGSPPVKITVASSDPGVFPRFRRRMYAAQFVSGAAPNPGKSLLELTLQWARAAHGT